MIKMRTYLTLLLLLLGWISIAQEQSSFSLEEAENYGVTNNEKMLNSALDYEAARKKVWETTAIGLPQISAEGAFQNFLYIPTSVVDATLFNPMAQEGEIMEFQMGQKYSTSLTFNVNQLIFNGSYIVGLKFSKFYMQMTENGMERTKNEVKSMVREAYYNVLVADKNVEQMDSILVSTEKLLAETEVLLANNVIHQEDADQLKLTLNRIKSAHTSAVRQAEVARYMLKLNMGYDLDAEIEITENLDDVLNDILAENPVSKDYNAKDNSNYQMLSEQKVLDGFNVQNEKAGYYPSVGAFLSHSQNAFRNEFNFFADEQWYPTTVWGVQVQIPITTSGQKVMKVQQAEIKLEQDQNNLQSLERTLEFQELNLKAQFQNAHDQMVLEKENVELAKFIYSQSLKRKKHGAVSSLEVTQLQNQLLQAEATYIGSIMNLLSVKIQLDKLFNQ